MTARLTRKPDQKRLLCLEMQATPRLHVLLGDLPARLLGPRNTGAPRPRASKQALLEGLVGTRAPLAVRDQLEAHSLQLPAAAVGERFAQGLDIS